MTAHYQSCTNEIAKPYFQQKQPLQLIHWKQQKHLLRTARQPRIPQLMTSLALVGVVLLLWVQPALAAVTITEFKVSTVGVPQGITAGSDGALWFTEFYDNVVGRINTNGKATLFRLNTQNSATYITAGPEGDLWLTLLNDVGGSTTNQIGRLTTKGVLTTFTIPKASYPWDITTGPDNNLYFTDGASNVWRMTTSGHFTRFPFKDSTNGYPYQITKGPDGNLWFTDRSRLIVKMTPSGQFTSFTVPATNGATDDITTGPDGNLWFTFDDTDTTSKIGRITPSGVITEFTFPSPGNHDYLFLNGITTGPDGNLWFTYTDWNTKVNAIGRITTGGAITLWPTPTANSSPTDITPGPDGALWFTEAIGNVGRITTH